MNEGWICICHVMPIDDLIEHEWSKECICGPRIKTTKSEVTVITHNSLDGRELSEPDYKPDLE